MRLIDDDPSFPAPQTRLYTQSHGEHATPHWPELPHPLLHTGLTGMQPSQSHAEHAMPHWPEPPQPPARGQRGEPGQRRDERRVGRAQCRQASKGVGWGRACRVEVRRRRRCLQLQSGLGGGGGDGAGAQPSQSHEEHATPHCPEPPQAQLQNAFLTGEGGGDTSSGFMSSTP